MRRRHLGLALLASLPLLHASSAAAYVRSRTDKGTPIFWQSGCAFVTPDAAGSMDLPMETVLQVIDRSIASWQAVTTDKGCSYFHVHRDAPATNETGYDKKNIVKFRGGAKFCRPAEGGREEVCYSPQATAITTIFYVSAPGKAQDGNVADADIELNQVNFTFVVVPSLAEARPATTRADLENTLTHELGHLLGLDHTCRDSATVGMPTDDQGAPVPGCDEIASEPVKYRAITESTMYNFTTTPNEIRKRTPEADDARSICEIYPTAKDPGSCKRVGDKGCAIAGGLGAAAERPRLGIALLLLVLGLRRADRARRRRARPPRR